MGVSEGERRRGLRAGEGTGVVDAADAWLGRQAGRRTAGGRGKGTIAPSPHLPPALQCSWEGSLLFSSPLRL